MAHRLHSAYVVRETPEHRDVWTARRDIPAIWFPRVSVLERVLNWLKGVR